MARAYFDQNPFGAAPIEPGLDVIRRVYSQRAPTPMESLSKAIQEPFVEDVIVPGISRIASEARASMREADAERAAEARTAQRQAAAQAALGQRGAILERAAQLGAAPVEALQELGAAGAEAPGPSMMGLRRPADIDIQSAAALLEEAAAAFRAGDVTQEANIAAMVDDLSIAGVADIAQGILEEGLTAQQAVQRAQVEAGETLRRAGLEAARAPRVERAAPGGIPQRTIESLSRRRKATAKKFIPLASLSDEEQGQIKAAREAAGWPQTRMNEPFGPQAEKMLRSQRAAPIEGEPAPAPTIAAAREQERQALLEQAGALQQQAQDILFGATEGVPSPVVSIAEQISERASSSELLRAATRAEGKRKLPAGFVPRTEADFRWAMMQTDDPVERLQLLRMSRGATDVHPSGPGAVRRAITGEAGRSTQNLLFADELARQKVAESRRLAEIKATTAAKRVAVQAMRAKAYAKSQGELARVRKAQADKLEKALNRIRKGTGNRRDDEILGALATWLSSGAAPEGFKDLEGLSLEGVGAWGRLSELSKRGQSLAKNAISTAVRLQNADNLSDRLLLLHAGQLGTDARALDAKADRAKDRARRASEAADKAREVEGKARGKTARTKAAETAKKAEERAEAERKAAEDAENAAKDARSDQQNILNGASAPTGTPRYTMEQLDDMVKTGQITEAQGIAIWKAQGSRP